VSGNRYAPPSSVLADAEEPRPGRRPIAVTIAVLIILAQIAIGVFGYLGAWRAYLASGTMNLIVLGVEVARWLLLSLTAYLLWRGRNAGRILLLVLLVFSLLSLLTAFWTMGRAPAGVRYVPDPMGLLMLLRPAAVYLTSSILVFFPGRAWFRRRIR